MTDRKGSCVIAAFLASAFALGGCGPSAEPALPKSSAAQPRPAETFTWPAGFRVMDDGFPKVGDPCRRLGETALTSNYLDDSARLVGCPGESGSAAAADLIAATGGKLVGSAEGVTLISIPMGDANQGMAAG